MLFGMFNHFFLHMFHKYFFFLIMLSNRFLFIHDKMIRWFEKFISVIAFLFISIVENDRNKSIVSIVVIAAIAIDEFENWVSIFSVKKNLFLNIYFLKWFT